MKKLTTLVLALFLTVGIAYGQNNADVDQDGVDHQATVDQVGNNMATVNQDEGNTNVALIDQDGNNEAKILQMANNFTGAPTKAEAYQYQDRGNRGQNSAEIHQAGGTNLLAQQWQYGSRLDADIMQGRSSGSVAEQDQKGSDHYANIRLTTSPNAEVWQEQHGEQGDGNHANSYLAHSDGVSVNIYQDGNNWANTEQRSLRDGTSTIDIDQDGLGNESEVLQGKSYQSDGGTLSATIFQDGDANGATIKQSNFGQTANVNQVGDLNTATITQN